MSRKTLQRGLAAAALLALPVVALGTTTAQADSMSPVMARLDPLKGTHAHGTATLTPHSNGDLTVKITDTGLVPGMPHAQHIHGDTSGKHFFCPGPSADKNHNGFISVEEGLPMYGNIDISLTTKGDTSPKSGLAVDRFPVADKNGNLSYSRTIKAADLPAGTISHLHDLHIVQHGVDANGNNKYDLKGLGESSFAKSLGVKGIPEEATDAATCGMIMPAGSVDTGGGTSQASIGGEDAGLVGLGALALIGSAATIMVRRRMVRTAEAGDRS